MPIAGKTRSGWASEILRFPRDVLRSTAFATIAPTSEERASLRILARDDE
jgi:hypothetical protein